jgi:hypothetical protein
LIKFLFILNEVLHNKHMRNSQARNNNKNK